MNANTILDSYDNFKAHELKNRFFKHHDILSLVEKLPSDFSITNLGSSFQNRSINVITWGAGNINILLWSQMHGDEATGTMAIFDLLNLLVWQKDSEFVKNIYENCCLHFIPMLNPDGAEVFTRRSLQQIDINRDFLQCLTPETKILKQYRNQINPEFSFTLHDQITLWSITGSLKPATLSFLSPAVDHELSIDRTREKAMQVIADIFETVSPIIPGHIGLFDDEYEPRAFGDNFQKLKTSTILIEAGGYNNDPEKQEIRKFYLLAMFKGILSIAAQSYLHKNTRDYFTIPKNNKQIFHLLVHNLQLGKFIASVGINYEEGAISGGTSTEKTYSIQDIGDLSFCDAYETIDASKYTLIGEILFNKQANFSLNDGNELILCFKEGRLC